MSVTSVSSLHIYPIKSTAGISLAHTIVEELGLSFDRRFVVSDPSGLFITGRTEPTLCLVQSTLVMQGITLSAPNMPTLILRYNEFDNQYQNVTVWGDDIAGQLCSTKANAWFSQYLQRPCQLLFFGKNSHRQKGLNTDSSRKLAFADGYPLLLISQASLDDLNSRLIDNKQQAVSMAQFRPNIVIEHCLPFAEDGWQHIRIGNVEFMVSKPCERCIFTTVNPQLGEKNAEQQPLRTLKSFRQNQHGEVLFGQNLIALNNGQIKQGDELTVLSEQKKPTFILAGVITPHKTIATPLIKTALITKSPNKKITIHFEKWHKNYQVIGVNNTSKTVLENGEDAGLILPYSCRGGMCGRCKAKLISGEVKQSSTDGLSEKEKQDDYILCCSSVAISDVVIKHD